METISVYLTRRRQQVETALQTVLPQDAGPFADHLAGMRYSLLAGGKRIRPILFLAAAETILESETESARLLPAACALECIHTYSLIHDDLPAMDDDDLRRGQATNHKLFGEAAAILAGDSLLTFAFELLSRPLPGLPPERQLRLIQLVARASGPQGMAGGQYLDITNENRSYPFELLQTIHRSKTGALITCAVQAGAVAAGADSRQEAQLQAYGAELGLAFQITDDLLDVTATTEQLGKTAGSDRQRGKATYPQFFGIEPTRLQAATAVTAAKQALDGFGPSAEPLRQLADYIAERTH